MKAMYTYSGPMYTMLIQIGQQRLENRVQLSEARSGSVTAIATYIIHIAFVTEDTANAATVSQLVVTTSSKLKL